MKRCGWANGELYEAYHDHEWGVPSHDDRHLLSNTQPIFAELMSQRIFIDFFKEATPKSVAHRKRATDDALGGQLPP